MPTVEKLSIALPPEMAAQLRQAVATGEYTSPGEVIRDALRDWNYKRPLREDGVLELRKLSQKAIEDESPTHDPDEVFDELARKCQALAEAAHEPA